VEIQQSALGADIFDVLLRECHRLATQNYEHAMVYAGHRYERVQDGAGTWHYNLYAYYDPPGVQEELNPRNLNGAEQNVLGQTLHGNSLGDIGAKEQKF
jgi:hypothetical protein